MKKTLEREYQGPQVGVEIRVMRTQLGMTQAQLAERAGMQQSEIAQIENGHRSDLCFSTLARLAEALECKSTVTLQPKVDFNKLLERMSREVAERIVLSAAGSAAIELQGPTKKVIEQEIEALAREILKKKKSFLWHDKGILKALKKADLGILSRSKN